MMQPGDQTGLRAQLAGTNINEKTFLATDYLNHFNEIIMLLDMIADMPDCLEDARAWQPKSYIEHFVDSTFSDRALAIEAYHASPLRYRLPLEEIARRLDAEIGTLIAGIEMLAAENRLADCARLVEPASHEIKVMIQLASAVINGTSEVTTATGVARVLTKTSSDDISQGEIDKLF